MLGKMVDRVAFDQPSGVADGFGGTTIEWTEHFGCWAEIKWKSGGESVQAARLAGRRIYQVVVRSSTETRAVTEGYRMRDLQRGDVYDIKAVDPVADREWVYLTVEGVKP